MGRGMIVTWQLVATAAMATAAGAVLVTAGPGALPQNDGSAFAAWSAIARAQPRSPAKAMPGDHVVDWTGPDGQAIHLVVRVPSPAAGAPTVTVGPVAAGADARPAFDTAVARAASIGAGHLVIPPGTYIFRTVGYEGLGQWVIRGLHDVSIEGAGVTLVFTQNVAGIYLAGNQRLKLAGMNIEFSMPLASLATVTSQGGQNVLVVNSRYPVTATTQIGHVSDYDPVTHEWVKGGQRLYFPPSRPTAANAPRYVGNQTFTSPSFQALHAGGTVIAFHHFYGGVGLQVKDIEGQGESEDIVLDGIGIHGVPGMGVVATKMKRGFALLNSRITPRTDVTGLVSAEYDAVHTLANQGDILIANNTITGQGDDAINLNSPVQYILEVGAVGRIVQIANFSRFYRKGDHIAFFDGTGTMVGRAMLATDPRPIGGGYVEITLDAPVARLVPRMALRDIDQLPRRFAVIGNTIGHCQCHGVLAQIPHGLIRDNHFDNTTANAIRLLTNVGQWKEGVGAFNERVENNTIANSGPDKSLAFKFGAISVYGVGHGSNVSDSPMNAYIAITGNNVTHTAQACIAIASARDVTVRGNRCSATNLTSPGQPAIGVQGSNQAIVAGNTTQ